MDRQYIIQQCKEAVELDNNKDYHKARDKYFEVSQKLLIMSNQKDETEINKEQYKLKSEEYLNRAKELSDIIQKDIKHMKQGSNRLASFEVRKREAMELSKRAVELDENAKFEECINSYEELSKRLIQLSKEDGYEFNKNSYLYKAKAYKERIAEIKKLIFLRDNPEEDPNSLVSIKKRIKEFAKKAITLDDLNNYEEAYDLYIKAAELLNLLSKKDDDKNSSLIYKKTGLEYCNRAMELKKKIDETNFKVKDLKESISEIYKTNLNDNKEPLNNFQICKKDSIEIQNFTFGDYKNAGTISSLAVFPSKKFDQSLNSSEGEFFKNLSNSSTQFSAKSDGTFTSDNSYLKNEDSPGFFYAHSDSFNINKLNSKNKDSAGIFSSNIGPENLDSLIIKNSNEYTKSLSDNSIGNSNQKSLKTDLADGEFSFRKNLNLK